ncbi:MAG TPA: hypothetical protein PLI83_02735 [Thermomonas sp.]|nr:hypothetical protein [Thermomonas sp.]
MLKELIQFLVSLGEEKVLKIEVDGLGAGGRKRIFRKRDLDEILPEEEKLAVGLHFGSIKDFAAGVERFGTKGQSVVFVNRFGALASINPRCLDRKAEQIIFSPYYAALPSTQAVFDYPTFLELLDAFAGKIDEEDLLRRILKVVKVQKKADAVLEDKGGFVRITFSESDDVETGNQVDIPKYVTFRNIPYFDPSYTDIALKYRLSVSVEKGLAFKLTAMPDLDERDLKATDQALADLRNLLKDGDGGEFPVYRAADQVGRITRMPNG